MIQNLTLLQMLSNEKYINAKYNAQSLYNIISSIGISSLDSNTIDMLYFCSYYLSNLSNGKYSTTTKLSLNQFVNDVISDDNISSLLSPSIATYKSYLIKFSDKDFIIKELNRLDMYNELKNYGFTADQINMIYANVYKTIKPSATDEEAINDTTVMLTPYKVITIAKSSLGENDSLYSKLALLINIMDLSYSQIYNIVPIYDYSTLATYLSQISKEIDLNTVELGYGYYDYKNNVSDLYKTMSIKELFKFIENNKNDKIILSKLNDNLEMFTLGYNVINNTETKYNYKDLSNLIGQNESVVKAIYGVDDCSKLTTALTPIQFVDLILNNQNHELLSSKLTKNTINRLNLVKTVMNSTINNTKYNAKSLAKILDTNPNTLSLVMSLYDSRYIKSNETVSLLDFTNFIIKDVITNPTYSSKFDNEAKIKLNIVNGLMKNTLNKTKYNSYELYTILNKLSNKLDYNLVDLVYIYHGSESLYENSWKLTVEDFINYLNDDLLKDEKFANFIYEDMNKEVKNAKVAISDAKNLLVTKSYSRAIINSKYGFEDKDTFEFVQNAIDTVGKNDGIYVIGDSPMALEISRSFGGELDYITVLTIIFIFVVVALTFKDLLIPLILVLIIQSAVFVTMSILSMAATDVYFISLLIVQAILMGATIDYAIVYTTYYKESRASMGVQDSIINAYNKSIHTILSSSAVLIVVTLIVSTFTEAIAAKICETISQGTFCSVILILFVLPGVLAIFDKLICKKGSYKR